MTNKQTPKVEWNSQVLFLKSQHRFSTIIRLSFSEIKTNKIHFNFLLLSPPLLLSGKWHKHSSLNIQGGLWFGKRDMKLGPSICAKTQQLSWGSYRRVIPRLLQITQDRSFNLFRIHIALCRVSSSRLQNHCWSSRSTKLNWNSTSSQPQVFVPPYH